MEIAPRCQFSSSLMVLVVCVLQLSAHDHQNQGGLFAVKNTGFTIADDCVVEWSIFVPMSCRRSEPPGIHGRGRPQNVGQAPMAGLIWTCDRRLEIRNGGAEMVAFCMLLHVIKQLI